MLPFNCLTNTVYPLKADIYYSSNTQDSFGTILRTWVYDREIPCGVISKSLGRDPELTPDLLMKFKDDLSLRTPEDIRVSAANAEYPLTEILVTNIRNSDGLVIWQEYGAEFAGMPTAYEVRTVAPSLDPFQNIDHYYIYIARSQNQTVSLVVPGES
jgi:hypothetical protein